MPFRANSRLAWGVAFASIALWAATAPASFGQLAWQSAHNSGVSSSEERVATTHMDVQQQNSASLAPGDASLAADHNDHPSDTQPCEPTPSAALAEQPPGEEIEVPPAQQPPVDDPSDLEATFRLCGTPDEQAERAIEQLVAGRSFRARLSSRSDGCADLTIVVSPQSPSTGALTGRQSTSLTVSAGSSSSAPARSISVRINTENGVTRVSIGDGA